MKKRTVAAAAALAVMISSFAGCGQQNVQDGGNAAGDGGQVELTIMGGAQLLSVTEIVLKDYLAEHPNISVKYEKYSYAEYPTKMKLQLSNQESTPDIVLVHDLFARQFVEAGSFLDLTDMVQEDSVLPVLDTVTMDGKIYGLPNQVTNAYVYLYRKDLYDTLGLQPPKTFEEYYEQGLVLKENGYYAGAFDPGNEGSASQMFNDFVYMLGGEVLNGEGEVTLNKGEEALELMKRCYDAGIWHKSNMGNDEAYWAEFNAGKIAAFPAVSCQAAYYETNVDPGGDGGWGHLAMAEPMKFSEDGRSTYIGNTEYFAINKSSKHQEEAKELIAYLALSEEAALKCSDIDENGIMAQYSTGYMDGLRAVAADTSHGWDAYGGEPVVSEVAQLVLDETPYIPFVDEKSAERNKIISEVVGDMLVNGSCTAAEAVEKMRERMSSL